MSITVHYCLVISSLASVLHFNNQSYNPGVELGSFLYILPCVPSQPFMYMA